MAVRVRVPASLQPFCGGRRALDVDLTDGASVEDLLDRLATEYPALERRLRDEQGRLRRHVNVFLGSANIKDSEGLSTVLADGTEVSVLPAVSGG